MDDRAYCIENLKQCHIRYDPSSLLIGKKEFKPKNCRISSLLDRFLPQSYTFLVFFSVLMGAMNVGQAMPYVEAFSMAKASAATIFR